MAGTIVKIKQSSVAGRLPTHNTAASTDIVQGELALNTADQKLYSKDSSGSIFEIGAASGAVTIQTTEFVATSSQTSFAVTYSSTKDHINVYFNGVWLPPTDFTATSGTAVVLDTGASTGTEIVIQVVKALTLANGSEIDEHEFTATASQTSFTITGGYTAASDVEVYVNGVKLRAADFTRTSGTAIVLATAATVNDEVSIRVIKVAVLANIIASTGDTGAAVIPAGTTAQRDSSPAAGYLRWNTTLNRAEIYNDNTSAWQDVGQQTLTTEQVQDAIGPMLSGNTETGIDVTYDDTNNQIDFAIDSTVATLTGTQTLSAKTLTSPVINTGVSGSAILDSDTMSGASATTLSSSESIKAYVDAQILAVPDAVAMSIALG